MFSFKRFALLFCAASLCLAAPDAPLARAKAAITNLPLRFEKNDGQFDPAARYAARSGPWSLLLTQRGPRIQTPGARSIDLTFLRSNPTPAIEALDPMQARTDYFLGRRENWHTRVANFGSIRYREVYPGVDVIYYGRQNRLEYDFVLQPGADPSAIRLRFNGARRVRLTEDGDVALDTAGGRILQKLPVIYQQDTDSSSRREVRGRYVLLARNVVGLKLDAYDRTRALTIDPVVVYSTYLGAPLTDKIVAVKLDSKGLLYVTGPTDNSTDVNNPNLGAVGNFQQGANAGLTDIFVAIIDTKNHYNLVYYSYLGGTNNDIPTAMQIDAQGRVYLTGSTTSTDFPIQGNAAQATGTGAAVSAFVAAIDPNLTSDNGALFYSTYLGTNSGNSIGNGIDLDAQGNIYVIGTTRATDFPVTSNAYAQVMFGPQDAFLCELNIFNPNIWYSTFLGAEGGDDGRAIAVTPAGLVYFAINTVGQQFPQAGNQYQPTLRGLENIAIGLMDFTKSGVDSLLYSTYFGGSVADEARKLSLDAKGNLLITGQTISSDFPVTGDAAQLNYGGNGDAFAAVLNPGSLNFLVYSTYLGGSHGEVAYDIAGDAAGSLYVTGYTLSSDFPVTSGAPKSNWGGGIDVFLTKLKPNVPGIAGFQLSTYMGEATVNVSSGLAVAPDGTIYFAGYTGGLWPTTNPTQNGFGGGYSDGFIAAVK